jgi:uncharacterized protein with PIN domain
VCNAPLEEADGAAAPERVRASCDRFWKCPSCARLFWRGDHVRHMEKRFRSLAALPPADTIGSATSEE